MNALKIDLDISGEVERYLSSVFESTLKRAPEARLRQFQMADVTTYTPTIEHATPIEPSRLRQGMLVRVVHLCPLKFCPLT